MKDLNAFAIQLLNELEQRPTKSTELDNVLYRTSQNQLGRDHSVQAAIDTFFDEAEILAAVSGRFHPTDLVTGIVDTEGQQVLNRLSMNCVVETSDLGVEWSLTQPRRKAVLRQLAQTQMLQDFIGRRLPKTDLFGQMLRSILKEGADILLENRTHNELLAISAAAEALADTELPLPDADKIRQYINKDSLFADYEVLLRGNFVGRKSELDTLDRFLRQGNSRSTNNRWSGLIVNGLGGAGKSTLLAKFAQQLVKARTATVIMLDFDRPGIDPSPANTFLLEAEVTRQVGLQYPKQYKMLRDVRTTTRQRRAEFATYKGLSQSADNPEKARGFRSPLVEVIGATLHEERMSYQPILLILDTFEEVVHRELTKQMFDWLTDMGDGLAPTPLRVVFSGRLFDTSLAIFARQGLDNPLLVNELEPRQAQRLLQHLGVTEAMAKRLTRSGFFPLRPLELQLLGKIANREESTTTIEELETEIRRGGEKTKELFVGLIYRRVLLRIKDPTTELLAYPGLMLRYVTPELIQQVLAPVLNLPVLTLLEAENALKKLADYDWLVQYRSNEGRQQVWHRRDLRQSMLRLMMTEDPIKTKLISEAAIRFFERSNERDEIEALYHKLIWMDLPEDGEGYDLDQLKRMAASMGSYMSDLPKAAAVLLQFAAKGSVQAADVSLLPSRYLATAYHKTGRRLVNNREFAKALRLLRRGQKEGIFTALWVDNPRHDSWETETLFATACWDEIHYLPTPPVSGSASLLSFADKLYHTAITDPVDALIDEVNVCLEQTKQIDGLLEVKNDWRGADFVKLVTNVSLGLVALNDRLFLSSEKRDSIAKLVEAIKFNPQLARSARLQQKMIFASWIGTRPGISLFWIGPSLLRLHLPWLEGLAKFAQRASLSAELVSLINLAITTFQTSLQGRQRTVRRFLRSMDALYKERELWQQLQFSILRDFANAEDILTLFRGPDTEFRDPSRFALMEAFPDPASRRELGGLIESVVPLDLVDLTPDAFSDALAADPETALENYIELVDRAWQLGPLLRLASVHRQAAPKLQAVLSAYEKWDLTVRNLITSFSGFIYTNPLMLSNMITADLTKTATLDAMILLSSEDFETIERPGHEPTTSVEELEGRQGYDPQFLGGWTIPLPGGATELKTADMRKLRRGGNGVELTYKNFSVIMSASRRMAMLTAVNINGLESRSVPRINSWNFDGRLDPTDQWGDDLYVGNALDRGHMVRREDPNWGTFEEAKQANIDTFHFTNSCPQMAGVNQKTWLGLENHILQHARADRMRVSVFTGPYFSDSDLQYRGALVPKAFWKVVAIVTETGRPSATAYKISQEKELQELEFVFGAYKTYQISIRQVIADTGLDFSDLLPFDGFSTEEAATGNSMTEALETLSNIRI